MICLRPIKGRKPKADTIRLKIHNNNLAEVAPEVFAEYKTVYDYLGKMWNELESDKARVTADLLKELGVISEVHKRVVYYQERVNSNKMTLLLAQNSLKKMLRLEYKVDTETQKERAAREEKERKRKEKYGL